MSQHTHDTHAGHEEHGDHASMTKKDIRNVFLILLGITAFEFLVALVLVPKNVIKINVANPIYIVLTLLKAYYIIAFFMHLKFEKKGLVYSLVIPIIFIIGLILVLTNESNHWLSLRDIFPHK